MYIYTERVYIHIENLSVLYPTGNFQNPIMAKNKVFFVLFCVYVCVCVSSGKAACYICIFKNPFLVVSTGKE